MNIPEIPNALANIKNACDQKMAKLYPVGIPKPVLQRYHKELQYIERLHPCWQSEMELFRLLCEEAKRAMQYFTLTKSSDGNSFIIYLLSGTLINPLKTHYYCEHCGYYEEPHTQLFGIDLPSKNCPNCETLLRRDGFNLNSEFAFGPDGRKLLNYETSSTQDFIPFAKRVLERIYPQNEIVPLGKLFRLSDNERIAMIHSGFYILPSGRTLHDYSEIASYLEDGTPCISGEWHIDPIEYELKKIDLMPNESLEYLYQLQQKTGIYLHDITLDDLSDITWYDLKNTRVVSEIEHNLLSQFEPKNFLEMNSIIACIKNTYDGFQQYNKHDQSHALTDLRKRSEFLEYPCYTREDFWRTLESLGIESTIVFQLVQRIRTGRMHPSHFEKPTPLHELMRTLPDNFQKVASESLYVVGSAFALYDLLLYAMLAFYMKKDSKIYGRVVYNNQHRPSEYITAIKKYF